MEYRKLQRQNWSQRFNDFTNLQPSNLATTLNLWRFKPSLHYNISALHHPVQHSYKPWLYCLATTIKHQLRTFRLQVQKYTGSAVFELTTWQSDSGNSSCRSNLVGRSQVSFLLYDLPASSSCWNMHIPSPFVKLSSSSTPSPSSPQTPLQPYLSASSKYWCRMWHHNEELCNTVVTAIFSMANFPYFHGTVKNDDHTMETGNNSQ